MGTIHYPEWILILELPQLNSVYIFLIINHSLQLVHNEEQNSLCFRHTGQQTGGILRYLSLIALLAN